MYRIPVSVGVSRVALLALAVIVLASIVAVGCSSSSESSGTPTETRYEGVFTVPGVGAGRVTFNIKTPSAALQPAITTDAASTGTVTALIYTTRGSLAIADGTFTPPNGPLNISGSTTLTGMVSNGVLGGTITELGVSGTFTSLRSDSTEPVIQYCGTFADSGGAYMGDWNLAQLGTTLTGSWSAYKSSSSGTLSGTLDGATISLTPSDGGTATGTLDGVSMSGGWTSSDGNTSGTWQAAANSCG